MIKDITNSKEIANLIDSDEIDIPSFLDMKRRNTRDVVQKFLSIYTLSKIYDKNLIISWYILSKPVSQETLKMVKEII